LNNLNRVSKNTQTSNFMKIRPLGTQSLHSYGWTDRHNKTNSRFWLFCERD